MTKIVWILTIICILYNVRIGNSVRRAHDVQSVFAQRNWSSTTQLSKSTSVIARNWSITTEEPKALNEEADKWVGYSRQLVALKKASVIARNRNITTKWPKAVQSSNVTSVITQKNWNIATEWPKAGQDKKVQKSSTQLSQRRQTKDMPSHYDGPVPQKLSKKPGVIGGSRFANDYFSSKELWDIARNLEGQGVLVHGAARQGYNRPPWRQNFERTPPSPVYQQPTHAAFLDAGKEDGPQYGFLEGGSTKMAIMKNMFEKAKAKLKELGAKINPLNVESQLRQLPKKDDFGKPVRWVKFNSDDIAYGIAQVTDPFTMKNQQFTIDGAIYVPVKSHAALKSGDPDPDYSSLLETVTSAVAPINETMQTVARNVKLNQMTMMDWLITETMEITDIPVGKSCIANKCPARCRNMNCDSLCNGVLCTSGCVGVSCNAFCSGTGCLSMCIGESCSSKCTGYNCSTRCSQRYCFEYVNGIYTKIDPDEEPNPQSPKPNTRGRPPQQSGRPQDSSKFNNYGDSEGRNTYAYDYEMPGPPKDYGPKGPNDYGRPRGPNDYGRPRGPNEYGRPNGPVDYSNAGELGGYGGPAETGGYGRPAETGGYGRPAETGGYNRPAETGSYGRPGPVDYGNPGGPGNYERYGPVNYGRQGNLGRPKGQSNVGRAQSHYGAPWRHRNKAKSVYEEGKRPGLVRPGGPDGYMGPGYTHLGGYQRAGKFDGNVDSYENGGSDIGTPHINSDRPVFMDKGQEEIEKQLLAARNGPEYSDLYSLAITEYVQ